MNKENASFEKYESLLSDWKKNISANKVVHYNSSIKLWIWHYILGIISIILSAFVGSVIFYNLEKQSTDNMKIILGGLSIFAAILSVFQLHFRFSDRAILHKQCSSKFASLERKIELLLANKPKKIEDFGKRVAEISSEMYLITQETPAVVIDNILIAGGIDGITPTK